MTPEDQNPDATNVLVASKRTHQEEIMLKKPFMHSRRLRAASVTVLGMAVVGVLVALAGKASSAQDRYTLAVPDGLAFSEFKDYEKWQTIGVGHTGDLIRVILGDPTIIEAFQAGIPGNGKSFPDGSRMAKIHWTTKKNVEGFPVTVPDTLHHVDFMVRDSKRFPDHWGMGIRRI